MAEFSNYNQEYCDIGPKRDNISVSALAGEENGFPSGRWENFFLCLFNVHPALMRPYSTSIHSTTSGKVTLNWIHSLNCLTQLVWMFSNVFSSF